MSTHAQLCISPSVMWLLLYIDDMRLPELLDVDLFHRYGMCYGKGIRKRVHLNEEPRREIFWVDSQWPIYGLRGWCQILHLSAIIN